MRTLVFSSLLVPVLAIAAPAILVDEVPSAGQFVNYAKVQVPIKDLEKADPGEVEAGLVSVVTQMIPFAEQNDVTHICLLSTAGERFRSFKVEGAAAPLKLQPRDASFVVVLYRNGVDIPSHPVFSDDKPDKDKRTERIIIRKVAVPEGWTSDAWVYFNLPRIQDEARKDGASEVFLTTGGKGSRSPVTIPGMKKPLMVYAEQAELQAAWYVKGD